MSVESLFLQFSADKLIQFAGRIDVCLGRLKEDQIWARGDWKKKNNENAIGNLVLHLTGNVRQWILSSLRNAPDTRDRDSEFAACGGSTAAALTVNLRQTVEEAARIIAGLQTDQLTRIYDVQGYQISGVHAIFHVVEHFAQHTGQIIFATKMLTGEDMGFYRHLHDPAHSDKVL